MKRVFKTIIAFPKLILAAIFLLSLFFGYYSTKLEIDASSETLLLEHDKDLEIWREVSARYKTPNFLIVAYTPKNDLLDAKTLETIRRISSEFVKFDFVESVINITNVPLLENKKGNIADLVKHVPTLNDKDINLDAARHELQTSPLYTSNLVSKDLKTTAIVINLKPNLKYEEFIKERDFLLKKDQNATISEAEHTKLANLQKDFKIFRDKNRDLEHDHISKIREVIAEYKSSEQMFLGGISMIADDMVSFVKNDVVTYGGAAFLLLVLCLWIFFAQARFILIPILICIISVIFSSGLFGLLGFEVTVISSNYVALQLIITVSVAIHLVVGYREFASKFPHFSQNQLVYMTLKDRAKPCFFAIFTTVVGFFSLVFCDIKPIIMLGVMMSIGISISFLISFFVFGATMVLLNKAEVKYAFENRFKFTQICAQLALKQRGIIYLCCLIIVLVGIYGISKLKVENSFIGYFKQSTEIYAGMAVIDKKLGGTVPLDIIIKFKNKTDDVLQSSGDELFDSFEDEFSKSANEAQYWFSSEKMRIVQKVHNFVKNREFVGNIQSLATLLEVGKTLNSGKPLDSFMLSVMYNELPQNYRNIILSPYVSIENNEARFAIRTLDSDKNLRRDEFIKSLKHDLSELLKDENVEFEVSGVMILYNNMLQSLVHSQLDTLGFVLLALFIVFIFLFKSVKLALIAIVVNLIPLSLVFGIMGIMGIPLDIMSITIAAISIGIGVDDVIHYIHRYKLERRTLSQKDAIVASHASIGYAMYYTSFAIFLGFSVMCVSNFWPTIYFGMLVDLVMILLLLSALLILPSLILSYSKK